MKQLLYAFVFLSLAAENGSEYASGYWTGPLGWVFGEALFHSKLLFLPTADAITLLLIAGGQRRINFRNPMIRALQFSLLGIGLIALRGLFNGGEAYQMQFQVHGIVAALLLSIAIYRVLRTPDEYVTLGKWVVAAATYRAVMCIAFYVLVVSQGELPEEPVTMTTHDDSVLFALAAAATTIYAVLRPTGKNLRWSLITIALILLGIQFNNRRLAWVGLVGTLVTAFVALPISPLRGKIVSKLLRYSWIIVAYVAIGTGRPEPIFKPLRSLDSVTSGETDPSTKSRDNENIGLLVTLGTAPLLGTGLGIKYIETDDSLAPHGFVQYRYLPHNSVLALLAFGGSLGFALIWMVFPVCSYLALRTSLHTRDTTLRLLGMSSLCMVASCSLQMWGDMGMIATTCDVLVATGLGCAAQLAESLPATVAGSAPPPTHRAPNRRGFSATGSGGTTQPT